MCNKTMCSFPSRKCAKNNSAEKNLCDKLSGSFPYKKYAVKKVYAINDNFVYKDK